MKITYSLPTTSFAAIFFFAFGLPLKAESDQKTKVFLLAGQSNMQGRAKVSNLRSSLKKPHPTVKIWNQTAGKWDPLSSDASANKKGAFGPEISFARTLAKKFPKDDIRLIKYAVGGTALYNDWSPETKGPQYRTFMKTTKAALTNLDSSKVNYELSGMLWLQGESDAQENQADSYEKNLTEFISHIRTEFSSLSMPVVIARVRDYYGGKSGQAKIVRDTQVKIAEASKTITWFNTDDCELIDPGHYNAKGQIKIGKRFALKYIQILKKK